jgi:hypothetical protein
MAVDQDGLAGAKAPYLCVGHQPPLAARSRRGACSRGVDGRARLSHVTVAQQSRDVFEGGWIRNARKKKFGAVTVDHRGLPFAVARVNLR